MIVNIRFKILCFFKTFSIILNRLSSVCFLFMYSNSMIIFRYFQFLSMKNAIINKYDWRLKANQIFKIRETFVRCDKCSNSFASTSFNLFMMWFFIVNEESSLTYEFKHWKRRLISILSLIVKFWFVTTAHRKNCVEKFSRINTWLCSLMFWIYEYF
jgi:hypothetical protein